MGFHLTYWSAMSLCTGTQMDLYGKHRRYGLGYIFLFSEIWSLFMALVCSKFEYIGPSEATSLTLKSLKK